MGKVYDTILVIVDPLMKYVILLTVDQLNTEDFVMVIYDILVKYFIILCYIVSD